jgi:hypothetical protein
LDVRHQGPVRRPVQADATPPPRYIAGIIKSDFGFAHQIGAADDHIHILCDFPPTVTVADFIWTFDIVRARDCLGCRHVRTRSK